MWCLYCACTVVSRPIGSQEWREPITRRFTWCVWKDHLIPVNTHKCHIRADDLSWQWNMAGSRVALQCASWILVRQVLYCDRGGLCRPSRVTQEFVSQYSTFTTLWTPFCQRMLPVLHPKYFSRFFNFVTLVFLFSVICQGLLTIHINP